MGSESAKAAGIALVISDVEGTLVTGDKRLTAKLLGIATRTIYRRLEQPEPGDDADDVDGSTGDKT